jgi:hypothetical protein
MIPHHPDKSGRIARETFDLRLHTAGHTFVDTKPNQTIICSHLFNKVLRNGLSLFLMMQEWTFEQVDAQMPEYMLWVKSVVFELVWKT